MLYKRTGDVGQVRCHLCVQNSIPEVPKFTLFQRKHCRLGLNAVLSGVGGLGGVMLFHTPRWLLFKR